MEFAWIFDLLKWILKASWWFISRVLTGQLPWLTLLAVLIPTIFCAWLGASLVRPEYANQYRSAYLCASGVVGWFLGIGVVYLYAKNKE